MTLNFNIIHPYDKKLLLCIVLLLILANCNASIERLHQTSGSVDLSRKWEVEDSKVCGALRWMPVNEGGGKQKYSTCIGSSKPTTLPEPCSLVTEDWIIPRNVNSVFLEISGEFNNCTGKGCDLNYDLLVYLGNDPNASFYKIIAKIPKNVVKIKDTFFSYNDSIGIPVKGNTHMRLKFTTRLYCGDIASIKLFYYNCPSKSKELVSFKSQPAPSGSDTLKIGGKCTKRSGPDLKTGISQPYMICKSNGDSDIHGRCLCRAGNTQKNNECEECKMNEYKNEPGNHACLKCGSSSSSKYGREKCGCLEGFYRNKSQEENYSADCYRPPDAPINITIFDVSNEQATVKWTEPVPGSSPLELYIIECKNCPSDEKIFPLNTTDTKIVIVGLKSLATYQLLIYNENKITKLIRNKYWNNASFFVNTTSGGKPGPVRDFHYVVEDDYSITLTWKAPFNKGGEALKYIIKYGEQSHTTMETTWAISTGTEDRTYKITVYASAFVNGKREDGTAFTYAQDIIVKGKGIPLVLTIVVAASVIVFVIIVLLSAFCIWKKRNPAYLQVVRMENGAVQLPNKFFSHGKLYVDPTTYNAVDEAVQEFAKEIDRKDLEVGELLGGGEFAEVFKGTLYRNGAYKEVAIKTLKSGGMVTKRDRDDFFGEAAILGQFSDCSNVVKLEGVILKDRPNLIILEYMKNGALSSYLQENDGKFDVTQLLGMARCVANGMTYLSGIGFIHRDLAARNILVDEFNICKVSDFGMSREIKVDDTYDTQGGKIPVRWTAPESIQYKKWTSASDIWSYGILLWEIMSFGERPYWDWANIKVVERVNSEYRLPPPMNCPKVIHDLMLKCWHKDRTKRPKFKEIGDQIEQWIRTPVLLRGVAQTTVRKRDEDLDYTVLETIAKWLEAIGMGRYTQTFLNQGYSTPRQVLSLTMDDLEKLDIGPIGHKKKIYKAIMNTKEQVDSCSAAGGNKYT